MAKPQESEKSEKKAAPNDCFVIMPIADHDGYDKGHFTKGRLEKPHPAVLGKITSS